MAFLQPLNLPTFHGKLLGNRRGFVNISALVVWSRSTEHVLFIRGQKAAATAIAKMQHNLVPRENGWYGTSTTVTVPHKVVFTTYENIMEIRGSDQNIARNAENLSFSVEISCSTQQVWELNNAQHPKSG